MVWHHYHGEPQSLQDCVTHNSNQEPQTDDGQAEETKDFFETGHGCLLRQVRHCGRVVVDRSISKNGAVNIIARF